MTTLHAHVETYSTDCDGAISRDWVEVLNDSELEGEGGDNWFGDIAFHARVVADTVTSYSSFRGGRLEVTTDDEYGNVSLEWTEPTEEGGRSRSVRFCTDESCPTGREAASFRDHAAEAAGY